MKGAKHFTFAENGAKSRPDGLRRAVLARVDTSHDFRAPDGAGGQHTKSAQSGVTPNTRAVTCTAT